MRIVSKLLLWGGLPIGMALLFLIMYFIGYASEHMSPPLRQDLKHFLVQNCRGDHECIKKKHRRCFAGSFFDELSGEVTADCIQEPMKSRDNDE